METTGRRVLSASAGQRLAGLARGVPFRLGVALVCLVGHLVAFSLEGDRFGVPFNAEPGSPPGYLNPATDSVPQHWNRLVVSRWDSGNYIHLGLRGYQYCPPRPPAGVRFVPNGTCTLAFYPTYGLVGRVATLGGLIPLDYALFGVSLLASLLFLFMWTGPAIVDRLGLGETYLALVLLNVFTTGYALVTLQTEPLTLALTLGAFVAFTRRRWWLVGLLAGAASGMRITGIAVGAAAAVALCVDAWQSRPATRAAWAVRVCVIALCGWGALTLAAVHFIRFGDALAYVHAHSAAFKHEASLGSLLAPSPASLVYAMENPLHEGVWLVGGLLWVLLGHRTALGGFPLAEQAFWYTLLVATLGIAGLGVAPLGFVGMNRYWLLALPLFFSMAAVLKSRPAALVLWLIVSTWHYWNVDLCYYTSGPGNRGLEVCHAPHWIGRI